MPRKEIYYGLKEAEKLKQDFSSWINKMAHAGNGRFDTLKRIVVKPRRTKQPSLTCEKVYTVHFEFENNIKLNAHNFLTNNGLGHLELAGQEIKENLT